MLLLLYKNKTEGKKTEGKKTEGKKTEGKKTQGNEKQPKSSDYGEILLLQVLYSHPHPVWLQMYCVSSSG